ncbi:agmatine deiminase family protein [Streptomyces sp. NPDC048639]|uniref:agmatine deiminase family protein n=1 Tax=Streptomyces sp. NPDC048639 TaxID=3365581 RepID=UPI0037102F4B
MSAYPRRAVLRSGAAAALGGAGLLASACRSAPAEGSEAARDSPSSRSRPRGRMPAESRPHERTLMAWPPRDSVWGSDTPAVRRDIARIARAIAEHEPVELAASPEEVKGAQRACGAGVDVVPVPVDDLWMRDSGPTFVTGSDGVSALDFHFNGWGGKQEHQRDALVSRRVLERHRVPRTSAGITAEGGALEVDGAGTLLVTESSLVNANRNPGMSRAEIEGHLKEPLGVSTVIWLKGVRGRDITDYHVDALARFAEPGVVLLSRPSAGTPRVWVRAYEQARGVLEEARDARGKKLEIIDLDEPDPGELGQRGSEFLGCYANYYVVNGAVIVPRFGDARTDDRAASLLRELHPGRVVVPLEINMLAEGGGGIHCSTQQQPAA